MSQWYDTAAVAMLALHLAWILWVILGALWTRGRPWLTAFHVGSLVWGIVVEMGPWPCPLTMAEQLFQVRAGAVPYRGSFLLHWLDRIVYPNLPASLLAICGVAVCVANLLVYFLRYRNMRHPRRHGAGSEQ